MKKMIIKKIDNINRITLRPLFRRIIGWKEIDEKINTIHHFLNTYFDISQLPKATGLLRQVQIADTELLRIVTDILTKNELRYWLDYGTLLGAVRHRGFIPWDDDLDIAMPRKDYNIAIQVLPGALAKHGIGCKNISIGRFWIHIWDAGLMLDVIPYDNVSLASYSNHEQLKHNIVKCKRYYRKHQNKTKEFYDNKRKALIGEYTLDNPIWFQCPEWGANVSLYKDSTIFPLKLIRFEDYSFFVPNDYSAYLSTWYGDYMAFPKTGVLHHKGSGNGVHNNSIKHEVDMDKLIFRLKDIHPLE